MIKQAISTERAAAIYAAMEALYDVGGALTQVFVPAADGTRSAAIADHGERGITVTTPVRREHYVNWSAFCDAYAVHAYRAR